MQKRQRLAVLAAVQVLDRPGLGVVPRDRQIVASKDLAQLVADEINDAAEVERAGHALLDAVDDRQLGVALFGLLQQPLRLVEQAGVLERHAHARGPVSYTHLTLP